MTSRLIPGLVALASVLLVSCYPYPENQPRHRANPNNRTNTNKPAVTPVEQDKLKEDQLKLKKAEEEKKKQAETINNTTEAPKQSELPKPSVTPPRADYEYAMKAPGKEGFVLSPYNKKLIDVRGFAKGSLAQDPTYPASEKKYFRVP